MHICSNYYPNSKTQRIDANQTFPSVVDPIVKPVIPPIPPMSLILPAVQLPQFPHRFHYHKSKFVQELLSF